MHLFGEKKYAVAESWFRLAIKADPRYKAAWQALVDTLKEEGKTAQASAAQKIADASPDIRQGEPPPLTTEQLQGLSSLPSTTKNDAAVTAKVTKRGTVTGIRGQFPPRGEPPHLEAEA